MKKRGSSRRMPGLALAALLCWTAAHGQDPAAASAPGSGSTLELSGVIDAAMLDRFNEAVAAGNITTVRISSAGGQPKPALEIAEAMLARNLDVVVRGVCVGPCAQYILVAARNRHIEDGALVGFNFSATWLTRINDYLGEDAPEDFRSVQGILDVAAAEARLYERRGVATSLLQDPLLALQPHCVIFHRKPDQSVAGFNVSGMIYTLWVPTRKQLQTAGVRVGGFWPKSRKQMREVAGRIARSGIDTFRFGDEDHLRRKRRGRYSLEVFRNCSLEEVGSEPAAEAAALPGDAPAPPSSGGSAE